MNYRLSFYHNGSHSIQLIFHIPVHGCDLTRATIRSQLATTIVNRMLSVNYTCYAHAFIYLHSYLLTATLVVFKQNSYSYSQLPSTRKLTIYYSKLFSQLQLLFHCVYLKLLFQPKQYHQMYPIRPIANPQSLFYLCTCSSQLANSGGPGLLSILWRVTWLVNKQSFSVVNHIIICPFCDKILTTSFLIQQLASYLIVNLVLNNC